MVWAPVVTLSHPVAVIDLDALVANYGEVRRLVGGSVQVLAMVKADGYGHGAVAVAEALYGAGCRRFGVACLDEAGELRDAGLPRDASVVVFGGLLAGDASRAVDLGVEVVTQSPEVVRALGGAATAVAREVAVHVKVDTGMRRLGVEPAEAGEFAAMVSATSGTRPVALCSHFAQAESVTGDVTRNQLKNLELAAASARSRGLELARHLANSAAIMTRPETHMEMVRPGLMLYGLYPSRELERRAELSPVMALRAPVVRVASVGPLEGVGYGHAFRTARRTTLATLRCGYADGYPRSLSNSGRVWLRGTMAPVVGRVCMDHCMVDVTGVADVAEGDLAEMWGPDSATATVAETAGTIPYELVARLGKRVHREFLRRGRRDE